MYLKSRTGRRDVECIEGKLEWGGGIPVFSRPGDLREHSSSPARDPGGKGKRFWCILYPKTAFGEYCFIKMLVNAVLLGYDLEGRGEKPADQQQQRPFKGL